TLDRARVRRGRPAYLDVRVRPAFPGLRLEVHQRRAADPDPHVVPVRLDGAGRARVPLRTGRTGTYEVEVHGDLPEHWGTFPTRRLVVR
ncbi:MAG: hypothetical protein M3P93_15740, partial [Actinomycetota bacterium]|nr:hypothetical protein [Actinomycetota bacterium]